MWTRNRTKLIKDLNETALGLIEEAEYISPEQSREMVELASTLDRLRVSLLRNQNRSMVTTSYTCRVPANCA